MCQAQTHCPHVDCCVVVNVSSPYVNILTHVYIDDAQHLTLTLTCDIDLTMS